MHKQYLYCIYAVLSIRRSLLQRTSLFRTLVGVRCLPQTGLAVSLEDNWKLDKLGDVLK